MADGPRLSMSLGAYISGAVIGDRVTVGDYAVQVHPEHGTVVKQARADEVAAPRPRTRPEGVAADKLPPLLGREDVVRILAGALGTGSPVEVVGAPGAGKTSLLRALAQERAEALGGLVLISAAGQPGEDVLQDLFESFYECEDPTVPTVVELGRLLQDARALVVLDDVELARGELERVMSLAPQCALAIGSDERRVWGDSRSMPLGGLDERSCLGIAERELGRELSERERVSLGRLALAVGGHPLRIVQAAHLIIEGRRGRSDGPAPQGSPSEQFDQVLAQSLDEGEERLLGPLAAVPGAAFDARQLGEITGIRDPDRALSSLAERGLIRPDPGGYRLAGTLRDVLTERLDTAAWRDRALHHLAGADELGPDSAPTILALIDAASEAGDERLVVELARKADRPLAIGCRWGAWRETLDRALVAARQLGDRREEGWVLHQLGSRAGALGGLLDGITLLKDALQLRETAGDDQGARATRHNLEAFGDGTAATSSVAEAAQPPAPSAAPRAEFPAPPPPEPPAPPPPEPPRAAPAPEPPPASPAPAPPLPSTPPPPATAPGFRVPTPQPPSGPPPTPQPPAPARHEERREPPPLPGPPPAAPWRPPPPPPPPPARRTSQVEPPSRRGPSLPSVSMPSADQLPPLKFVIAAVVAVLLLVLIVRACSGGDDSQNSEPEGAGNFKNLPKSKGAAKAPPPKRLPVLPTVVTPASLQFSAPLLRLSKPQYVNQANRAGARVKLGRLRVAGRDRRDFPVIDGCRDVVLSRGERCRIVVSFVPKRRRGADPRTRSATVILTDGRGGRPRIPLTGSISGP